MSTDTLLTAHQAAAILGRCRSFCTKHAAALGGIKVGSRLMFTEKGLADYLIRQRVTDPAQPAPAPTRKPVDITKHRHAINRVTGLPWDAAPPHASAARETTR